MTQPSRLGNAVVAIEIALSCAVIAGGMQVCLGAVRHVLGHDFIWAGRDYVWMTPLGNVLLFGTAAIPFAILGAATSRVSTARITGFVFGTLAVLTLILLVPGLHYLAALAVAIGLGTRVASWLVRDPSQRPRALGVLASGVAVAILVVGAWREMSTRRQESRQVAALPAVPSDAPNVLVIILDTVRAASMSFLGYARETTPNLAALGAEGAIFEQAHATAPWTLPSHAGMFTARYPSQLSTDWQEPLDGADPTLAEVLARRGYRTGGFVANQLYTSRESGIGRGFEHYEDYRRTLKQVLLSTTLTQTRLFWQVLQAPGTGPRLRALARMDLGLQVMWTPHRKLATDVTGEFLRWQSSVGNRPFMAFLNLYDAHLPYDPPAPWDTKFSAARTPLDRYDGGIAYMDATLGGLFTELRARGVLDRTLVIVTSDHGEGFGEHGLFDHGNSLYRTELHVPLLLRYPPRVAAGRRVSEAVTLRDLSATVLDATGGKPGTDSLPGVSWLALLDGRGGSSPVVAEVSAGINTAPHLPVTRGAMKAIVSDSLHYIRNGDGVEEAYAWRSDSAETTDLSATPRARAVMLLLRDAIARAVR